MSSTFDEELSNSLIALKNWDGSYVKTPDDESADADDFPEIESDEESVEQRRRTSDCCSYAEDDVESFVEPNDEEVRQTCYDDSQSCRRNTEEEEEEESATIHDPYPPHSSLLKMRGRSNLSSIREESQLKSLEQSMTSDIRQFDRSEANGDSEMFENASDAALRLNNDEAEFEKANFFRKDDGRFNRSQYEKENSWEPSICYSPVPVYNPLASLTSQRFEQNSGNKSAIETNRPISAASKYDQSSFIGVEVPPMESTPKFRLSTSSSSINQLNERNSNRLSDNFSTYVSHKAEKINSSLAQNKQPSNSLMNNMELSSRPSESTILSESVVERCIEKESISQKSSDLAKAIIQAEAVMKKCKSAPASASTSTKTKTKRASVNKQKRSSQAPQKLNKKRTEVVPKDPIVENIKKHIRTLTIDQQAASFINENERLGKVNDFYKHKNDGDAKEGRKKLSAIENIPKSNGFTSTLGAKDKAIQTDQFNEQVILKDIFASTELLTRILTKFPKHTERILNMKWQN